MLKFEMFRKEQNQVYQSIYKQASTASYSSCISLTEPEGGKPLLELDGWTVGTFYVLSLFLSIVHHIVAIKKSVFLLLIDKRL